jgi:formate dehydrogenase subunit gamma
MSPPTPSETGRHQTLRICRAECCQVMDCELLVSHVEQRLGFTLDSNGYTTPDGRLTISPIYCLGNCTDGPSIMLDEEIRGHTTVEFLDGLIDQ